MEKQKNQGSHQSRQLFAGEKIKLTLWISSHPEDCKNKTAADLAKAVESELGFTVSESSVCLFRKEIFPELQTVRPRQRKPNGGQLRGMIRGLRERIEALENKVEELTKRAVR